MTEFNDTERESKVKQENVKAQMSNFNKPTNPQAFPNPHLRDDSDWQCYMFGNRPGYLGIVYRPRVGGVPNLFVRWMMRICFDCLWVKDKS